MRYLFPASKLPYGKLRPEGETARFRFLRTNTTRVHTKTYPTTYQPRGLEGHEPSGWCLIFATGIARGNYRAKKRFISFHNNPLS